MRIDDNLEQIVLDMRETAASLQTRYSYNHDAAMILLEYSDRIEQIIRRFNRITENENN